MDKEIIHKGYLEWWKNYRQKNKEKLREYQKGYQKARRLKIKQVGKDEVEQVKITIKK